MIFSVPSTNGFRYILTPILNLLSPSKTADNQEAQEALSQSNEVSNPEPSVGGSEPEQTDKTAPRNLRDAFARYEWQLSARWDSIPLRGMEAYMENDPDDIDKQKQNKGLERQLLREQQIESALVRQLAQSQSTTPESEDR